MFGGTENEMVLNVRVFITVADLECWPDFPTPTVVLVAEVNLYPLSILIENPTNIFALQLFRDVVKPTKTAVFLRSRSEWPGAKKDGCFL